MEKATGTVPFRNEGSHPDWSGGHERCGGRRRSKREPGAKLRHLDFFSRGREEHLTSPEKIIVGFLEEVTLLIS